jgi:polyisoprenoid-binding protein YceI
MKKILSYTLICVLALSIFSFDTVKISIDKSNSFIKYTLSHKLHESVGVTKDYICNAYYDGVEKKITKIAVAAAVASFDSQNSSRDSHALEVLEGIKYPKVTFVSSGIKQEGNALTINGEMNFHGVKRNMTILATQVQTDKTITLKAEFPVSLEKFKVERPSMMGYEVEDNLQMEFKAVFNL